MRDLTTPFTLTRLEVAFASSIEYIRVLWWLLLGIPLFGVIAIIWNPNDLIRGLGIVCLIWPLTIPLRAFTASAKAGGMYGRPTVVACDDTYLYLKGAKGMRLARRQVRCCRLRGKLWCIQTRLFAVLFVPDAALVDQRARTTMNELATRLD